MVSVCKHATGNVFKVQRNLVSSNTQRNPKNVPLKECLTYPKYYNNIHKMPIYCSSVMFTCQLSEGVLCGEKMYDIVCFCVAFV